MVLLWPLASTRDSSCYVHWGLLPRLLLAGTKAPPTTSTTTSTTSVIITLMCCLRGQLSSRLSLMLPNQRLSKKLASPSWPSSPPSISGSTPSTHFHRSHRRRSATCTTSSSRASVPSSALPSQNSLASAIWPVLTCSSMPISRKISRTVWIRRLWPIPASGLLISLLITQLSRTGTLPTNWRSVHWLLMLLRKSAALTRTAVPLQAPALLAMAAQSLSHVSSRPMRPTSTLYSQPHLRHTLKPCLTDFTRQTCNLTEHEVKRHWTQSDDKAYGTSISMRPGGLPEEQRGKR